MRCFCFRLVFGGVYFVPARSKELDPKNWTHGDPMGSLSATNETHSSLGLMELLHGSLKLLEYRWLHFFQERPLNGNAH